MELEQYLKTYKPSVLEIGCGRRCRQENFGINLEEAVGV